MPGRKREAIGPAAPELEVAGMPSLGTRGTLVLFIVLSFAIGLTLAALGPVLPDLAARNGRSLAETGVLFTALFLGSLTAQLSSGLLGDAFGRRGVLMGGAAAAAAGFFLACVSGLFPLTVAFTFLAGYGYGSTDLGVHVEVTSAFGDRSVAYLNLIGLFFGLGGFAGPALAGLSRTLLGTGIPSLFVGAALFLGCIPFFMRLPPSSPRSAGSSRGASAQEVPGPAAAVGGPHRHVLGSPYIWLIGLLLLVYVGIEQGVGGWITVFTHGTTGVDPAVAAVPAAVFWLSITAGRAVAAWIGTRLSASVMLAASIGIAVAGQSILMLAGGSFAALVFAVSVAGLGYGSIYPTAFAMAASAFPKSSGLAGGLVAAMGSLGGMILPALQGVVMENLGMAAGMLFALAACLAMAGIFIGTVVTGRRHA